MDPRRARDPRLARADPRLQGRPHSNSPVPTPPPVPQHGQPPQFLNQQQQQYNAPPQYQSQFNQQQMESAASTSSMQPPAQQFPAQAENAFAWQPKSSSDITSCYAKPLPVIGGAGNVFMVQKGMCALQGASDSFLLWPWVSDTWLSLHWGSTNL